MKKPQTILGIDPGLRHTGYVVLEDGKVREHGVILAKGHGKLPVTDAISVVLGGLCDLLVQWPVDIAAVEQVQWYGRPRAVTLPLSHVAGAIVGVLSARGIPVYLLLATQRRLASVKRPRRGWEEHDLDAYELAIVAKEAEDALAADASSIPRRLSAAARRRITVVKHAPG